jgi:hypothetical protein
MLTPIINASYQQPVGSLHARLASARIPTAPAITPDAILLDVDNGPGTHPGKRQTPPTKPHKSSMRPHQ